MSPSDKIYLELNISKAMVLQLKCQRSRVLIMCEFNSLFLSSLFLSNFQNVIIWIQNSATNILSGCQWKEMVHAGNTTYRADIHPNSTKPRHRNTMNMLIDRKTHRRLTETWNKHLFRERSEYRLGKVSNISHWGLSNLFYSSILVSSF